MNAALIITLVLVAFTGTVVVIIRDLTRQVIALGLFGLVVALLFIMYEAPDVAMAQAVVNGVIIPLLILLAITKTNGEQK